MSEAGSNRASATEAEGKYYDWRRGRIINTSRDGCPLADWGNSPPDRSFAVHPSGFRVFLPASSIERSDEYKGSDPYSVAERMSSEFQRRRVSSTARLLSLAASSQEGALRILDIGCGQGHITAAIQNQFSDAEVSGIDYSISAIDFAQRTYPGIDFSVADAYEPPYASGYFDAIVCNNIWEHVPDPLRLLAASARVLRPGGHVVISTPSRYRLGNAIRVLRGKPAMFMSDMHVTEYSVGQVIEQLRYGGFDVVATDDRPLSSQGERIAVRLVRSTIAPLLRFATRTAGSHHSWEATVFFLAQKRSAGPG